MPSGFQVVGWDQIGLVKSEAANLGADRWQALFAVYVEPASPSEESLPPASRLLQDRRGRLDFQPRFPLEPGLRYRARFDPRMRPSVGGIG